MRYFTPGPTELFTRTRELIQDAVIHDIPSLSHRSKAFCALYERTVAALRALLALPEDFDIFFTGSATEAMERIVQNCAEKRTHHFVNGAFSERFYEIARELGKAASETRVAPGEGFLLSSSALPNDAELVAITHNETSTGVSIPPAEIALLRNRAPHALIAVDIVSSAPLVKIDWRSIDCAFFSVQKCFGLPAGLGVLLVNSRAMEKSRELQKRGISVGSYHSFPALEAFAKKLQTPATPNVLSIFLLAGISEHLLSIGIDALRRDTAEKAELIYQELSSKKDFSPFVSNPAWRSETVITGVAREGFTKVYERLLKEGFEIGAGYGEFKDSHIRIANFPMHSKEELIKLLTFL